MNNILLNGNNYILHDSYNVNISDSFVARQNKIGSGSGEARLYISSQNNTPLFTFSPTQTIIKGSRSYPACLSSCYLVKENLLEYMEDTKDYYLNPHYSHIHDISLFYNTRLQLVNNLRDLIEFKVYNQNGNQDSLRFYIGSADNAWELIRELGIPSPPKAAPLSYITIKKYINIKDEFDTKYFFSLHFHTSKNKQLEQSQEIVTSLIVNDLSIDSTEKTSLIKARKGQGKFRSNVLNIMPRCPFTNISNQTLLRASHIIPWHKCQTNQDRLDGYNGLALSPTYDVLFDQGLISFENDGKLLISPQLDSISIISLNLDINKQYNIQNYNGLRDVFLNYHRQHVFKH